MKLPNTSRKNKMVSLLGAVAIGTGVFALTANNASATLTYDLRATGITGAGSVEGSKLVAGVAQGSVISFDVWVQITTAAGTGTFGYQSSVFDVLSSNGGSVLGSVGIFEPIDPWNISSVAGTPTDLDGDGDLDLGTNTANTTNGSPKPRASSQLTTAAPGAAVFLPVTNSALNESGFQFKVGTLRFTVTGAGGVDPNVPIGLDIRTHTAIMTAGALKNGAAAFTEGGTARNGSTGVFASTGPVQVSLIPVPEPSAFGMILLGTMGLVGLRRAGVRRS